MKRKKIKNFCNPISLAEFAEPTKDVEILQAGDWNHPMYGLIKITTSDLKEFVKNFKDKIRNDLPINIEHSNREGAVGWFKKLVIKGNTLLANVEWTTKGRQLLKEKVFKYFSPEFYSTYEDPETRKMYKNVLVGGALTNTPYFKGLKAIVFSEIASKIMKTLKEILLKEPKDLSDEEKETLKKHKEQLSETEIEKFKEVFEEEGGEKTEEEKKAEAEAKEKEEAETKEKEEKEAAEKKEAEEKAAEEKKGSEGMIQLSEAKVKILERNSEEGVKAMAELRKQTATTYVKSMTFSEKNPKGLLLPKSSEKVVEFLLSLSEEQAKKFKEVLGEFPERKSGIFKEVGKDEAGLEGNASDKVNTLVEAKMKDDKSMKYRDALDLVLAENPDLSKELA